MNVLIAVLGGALVLGVALCVLAVILIDVLKGGD